MKRRDSRAVESGGISPKVTKDFGDSQDRAGVPCTLICHPQKPTAAVLLACNTPYTHGNYSTERKALIQKLPEPAAGAGLALIPQHPARAGCRDRDAAGMQPAGGLRAPGAQFPSWLCITLHR